MQLTSDSKPKRILMTADTVGGVWTYALELARALGEANVEVALATMGALVSREQTAEAEKIENLRLFESDFKLEWMENPWRAVAAAGEWLLELENEFKPDIVHLNGFAHGALDFKAPKIVVGHSCVLSWWRAVKNETAPAEWNVYREQVSAGLRAADSIVAPTQAMLDALEENYGAISNKRVVLNGRDARLFQPAPKENFVFAAGRLWDEAKNTGALCRVAPDLRWKVCVAGETEHPANNAKVEDDFANVEFLGKLSGEKIADWFARAAIYALPARYEPFGLSVLEAALAGCALVLGDIPSLREIWRDDAVFVAPDDDQALQNAIKDLIENETRRADLAARARRRALSLTPAKMAHGYLEIYSQLIENQRAETRAAKEKFVCAS